MKVYTYSEARQRFATILECAVREGAVGIRRKDGQVFVQSMFRKQPWQTKRTKIGTRQGKR
ncbi:MAG: hypothetical protein ACREV3_00210 [Gammaproteobacteria bacterium]